jgi:4-diphosphocytidyl-2C-methyl-D-erythritol kinase
VPKVFKINKVDNNNNNNILMYQNGVFVSTSNLFKLKPLSDVKGNTYKSNGDEIDFMECEWFIELMEVNSREIPIDTNDTIDLMFTYLG